MTSFLSLSFMIGGVGLGVEEEVCSAIKGDISPLFCCDEEKKIDNHATFKPCIVLDCHSLLPKQSFNAAAQQPEKNTRKCASGTPTKLKKGLKIVKIR